MVRRAFAALTAVALLVTAGCGSETSPADDVPALTASLDRVDDAIAAEEYDAARDAVAALTEIATRAEEAGTLDADQADRIVSAAEELLAALPGAETPPSEPEPDPEAHRAHGTEQQCPGRRGRGWGGRGGRRRGGRGRGRDRLREAQGPQGAQEPQGAQGPQEVEGQGIALTHAQIHNGTLG